MKNLCYYFKRVRLSPHSFVELFIQKIGTEVPIQLLIFANWSSPHELQFFYLLSSTPFDTQNLKNMLQYNYLFNGKNSEKEERNQFYNWFLFFPPKRIIVMLYFIQLVRNIKRMSKTVAYL